MDEKINYGVKVMSNKNSPTANDPWYSTVVASTGTPVSGAAALLARIKAMGGMSSLVNNLNQQAVQQATQATMAAYVKTQQGDVIGFPKSKRKT